MKIHTHRRGSLTQVLPFPAFKHYSGVCVRGISLEEKTFRSTRIHIEVNIYTPRRGSLTHALLSQPLNTTTAEASDYKFSRKKNGTLAGSNPLKGEGATYGNVSINSFNAHVFGK